MNEIAVHPNVYATGPSRGLIGILERVWVREHSPGDGTIYVVSGFGNYNGGVRFFDTFRQHVEKGGEVIAVFSGSVNARLTSRQLVSEMLDCGASVHVVSRKRLLHAKCYGTRSAQGDMLVVTSANFTGPGMAQNVEMSVLLDSISTGDMNFSWRAFMSSILSQQWEFYRPSLSDLSAPAWQLLYDEQASDIVIDESDRITMIVRLSHADTARINATPGSDAAKGTQYFWLSKDCYNFFPPLTIHNRRGLKATYSCLVNLRYIDLGVEDRHCRVTFEAENNLDFRLRTGRLRYTRLAAKGDIAAISRVAETHYELRLFRRRAAQYNALAAYATNFIGHQGKKYGYLPNGDFEGLIGSRLGAS